MSFNRIFYALRFMERVEEGHQPTEEEIKRFSSLFGTPSKKIEFALSRCKEFFNKYIIKRCINYGDIEECIFTWNYKFPFKPFPIAMHATGTIILFEKGKAKNLLAFPQHKVISFEKTPGISFERYYKEVPIEVSKRLDGWHITAYYNPLIKRWTFATKYVLRNMYFYRGKLVSEPPDVIANPYVEITHKISEEQGLLNYLKSYEGWTINFVLVGPEPAVTKPPYPLPSDYQYFKLYLISVRTPEGKLLTIKETSKIINWETVPILEPKELPQLYEEVKRSLTTRSYIVRLRSEDPVNPLLMELESEYYPEAMMVKYLYNAKSLMILVTEGFEDEVAKIVEANYKENAIKLIDEIKKIEDLIRKISLIKRKEEIIKKILEDLVQKKPGLKRFHFKEFTKALERKNVKRVIRKLLSLVLEESSIAGTAYEELIDVRKIIEKHLNMTSTTLH